MVQLSRLFLLFIAVALFACNNTASSEAAEETAKEETATEETANNANEFGATFAASEVMSYDDLLSEMSTADSVMATVQGKVEAVCQAKGCWMNITSEQANAEEMMVKFKDYGFFVPKDIAGRQVIMQGKAYREVTPVDELQHLAEDAGKSAEEIAAITEPKVELKFMADGVKLLSE
ncbi:MAG: DUF4920 domain-containing protein [Saprospiraceae bacterium]|nr:DUF4920 domain-containing protein [Saprospiraceae bacterium]